MTIPLYDEDTLPCLTYPFKVEHIGTKRYLGNVAITGEVHVEVNIQTADETEINALHEFWRVDCNYGLEPFLIDWLPMFGRPTDAEGGILCSFLDEIATTKSASNKWTMKMKWRVWGTMNYIIDDYGQFIVNDEGEYTVTDTEDFAPTGNIINSYREVIYGDS